MARISFLLSLIFTSCTWRTGKDYRSSLSGLAFSRCFPWMRDTSFIVRPLWFFQTSLWLCRPPGISARCKDIWMSWTRRVLFRWSLLCLSFFWIYLLRGRVDTLGWALDATADAYVWLHPTMQDLDSELQDVLAFGYRRQSCCTSNVLEPCT